MAGSVSWKSLPVLPICIGIVLSVGCEKTKETIKDVVKEEFVSKDDFNTVIKAKDDKIANLETKLKETEKNLATVSAATEEQEDRWSIVMTVLVFATSILALIALVNIFGKPLARAGACVLLRKFSPRPRQVIRPLPNGE